MCGLWSAAEPSKNRRMRARSNSVSLFEDDDLGTGEELPIFTLPKLTNKNKTNKLRASCLTPRLAYYVLIWSPPSSSHRPLPLPPPYASVCLQLLNPSQYDGAGQTRSYPTRLLCAQQRAFWQAIRGALNEDDGMRIIFLLSLIVGSSTSYS